MRLCIFRTSLSANINLLSRFLVYLFSFILIPYVLVVWANRAASKYGWLCVDTATKSICRIALQLTYRFLQDIFSLHSGIVLWKRLTTRCNLHIYLRANKTWSKIHLSNMKERLRFIARTAHSENARYEAEATRLFWQNSVLESTKDCAPTKAS